MLAIVLSDNGSQPKIKTKAYHAALLQRLQVLGQGGRGQDGGRVEGAGVDQCRSGSIHLHGDGVHLQVQVKVKVQIQVEVEVEVEVQVQVQVSPPW